MYEDTINSLNEAADNIEVMNEGILKRLREKRKLKAALRRKKMIDADAKEIEDYNTDRSENIENERELRTAKKDVGQSAKMSKLGAKKEYKSAKASAKLEQKLDELNADKEDKEYILGLLHQH